MAIHGCDRTFAICARVFSSGSLKENKRIGTGVASPVSRASLSIVDTYRGEPAGDGACLYRGESWILGLRFWPKGACFKGETDVQKPQNAQNSHNAVSARAGLIHRRVCPHPTALPERCADRYDGQLRRSLVGGGRLVDSCRRSRYYGTAQPRRPVFLMNRALGG